MPGILAPILRPLRRWSSTGRQEPGAASRPRLARRLADAIDRAMALGLWEHADRLARTAASLAPGHARLSEPLARLRLAQGDPETALQVIDGCRSLPASLRLLRATCRLQLGARPEAQLDLQRWGTRSSAPLDARLLLGLLEWRDGDDAANRTLLRNLKHLEDPRTLQALLLVSLHGGRDEQAASWAQRLRICYAGGATGGQTIDVMLESLGLPGVQRDAEPTREQVAALAMELITFEPAIETLTEAQHRKPHAPTMTLIRRAIEQALPDLCDTASALFQLARLSLLAGDPESSRHFAQRGLEENPMSAPLAMLLGRLTPSPSPTPSSGDDHARRKAA
jgi:tetratricopeptide (TPR) repeat protein